MDSLVEGWGFSKRGDDDSNLLDDILFSNMEGRGGETDVMRVE